MMGISIKRIAFGVLAPIAIAYSPAVAAVDYTYCEIAGAAYGAEKEFIGNIASHVVFRQGLIQDSACLAVWRDAHGAGRRVSSTKNWAKSDLTTFRKMLSFETMVLDSVISGLNLDLRPESPR